MINQVCRTKNTNAIFFNRVTMKVFDKLNRLYQFSTKEALGIDKQYTQFYKVLVHQQFSQQHKYLEPDICATRNRLR